MFLLHFSFKYIWAKDFWFLYIRIYQYNLGSYKILVLYRRYLFSLCMAEQENVRKERWRNNHHSLIIILITFAAAEAAATAARKWILWSVLRTVVPNINCCQFLGILGRSRNRSRSWRTRMRAIGSRRVRSRGRDNRRSCQFNFCASVRGDKF